MRKEDEEEGWNRVVIMFIKALKSSFETNSFDILSIIISSLKNSIYEITLDVFFIHNMAYVKAYHYMIGHKRNSSSK